MIEAEVEEVRQKLLKDLETTKMSNKKEVLHDQLDEKKKEYLQKMKIIEEIKRDKEMQEQHGKLIKDLIQKQRYDEIKVQS